MNKLTIELENCYGIKKLAVEFDFVGSSHRTFSIYAPNGIMKTSFAKTLQDLSNNQESRDIVFPERKNLRRIKCDNIDLRPSEVFVVEPYNEQFKSDKLSTLLATKELKNEFDKIYTELESEKNKFITKLKSVSQSTDCESEFIETFAENEKEIFLDLLQKVLPELAKVSDKYDFRYNDIFDKKGKVKEFLAKESENLDLYIENYESLISKSTFFKKSKNSFGTYQAGEILKSIKDNSFFEAGHLLRTNDNTEIDSAKKFSELIESEINNVVNDKKLKDIFAKIDKAIGANAELRAFKNAIESNNLLLLELKDYDKFKQKVWCYYLSQLQDEVSNLIDFYQARKAQLENIIARAQKEATIWEKSIEEFNDRFKDMPFELEVKNKEDVILKVDAPTVGFIFKDGADRKVIDRENLLGILSQGEKRALYLLNIIFEIQARKKLRQKTLFIIDDIADSFDYKNKYAIIEYLVDISKEGNFYQIILTHNFDFFRTMESRLVGRSNCKMANKKTDLVLIEDAEYLKPFEYFKNNLHQNDRILIAAIPFVRNLAEYTGHAAEFLKLTSLLHIKSDTNDIAINELENIFKTILVDKSNLTLDNPSKKVLDLIFELADLIIQETNEPFGLENKIVLSIAIRLKAEQFMIKKINNQAIVDQITKNQTIELFKKYKELFPNEAQEILLLEQVNLMTPENIHLNSFMYEPILDMSDSYLKNLYQKLSELL